MTTTRQRATARFAARISSLPRLAALSATATAAVVVVGVTAAPTSPGAAKAQSVSLGSEGTAFDEAHFQKLREERVSRAATRLAPRVALDPKATDHKFATELLNVWERPREEGKRVGLVKGGSKVAVTGQVVGHWAEVLLPDRKKQVVRWVNADFLADTKPKPQPQSEPQSEPQPEAQPAETPARTSASSAAPAPGPSLGGACTNGSSVASGVSPSVVEIHQAVCANWPAVTTYGTFRADSGDHGSGRAVDIMVSGATGWDIAEFVRANAGSFGVSYVIYSQKIWSVDRAGEGWRYMEDRGSVTANHYDHVHVSVY